MSQATNKTVTVITQATKALAKQSADLIKATAGLTALVDTSAELADQIDLQSTQLETMRADMANAERVARAELNMQLLENEDDVLIGLLASRGLAKITTAEVQQLMADAQSDKDKTAAEIHKAVSAAVASTKAAADNELLAVTSAHAVASAKLKADAEASNSRIVYLAEALESAKETISAERDARIAIAASEATASGVVVNTSSK